MSPEDRAEEKKVSAAALKADMLRRLQKNAVNSPTQGSITEDALQQDASRRLQTEAAGKATGIEETPPWWNRLGHAAKRAVKSVVGEPVADEDYDPKMLDPAHDALGPLGYALAPATFATGVLDTLKNRDERTGRVAPLTTAINSLLDVFSIGKLNEASATMDQLYEEVPQNFDSLEAASALHAQATGEDFPTFARRLDEAALEQEKVRAANPGTAFGSDLVAMVGTGGALGKVAFSLANKAPAVVARYLVGSTPARVLFGSGVGAGETFAYSYNKNGDLEKATTDASLAMLGGTILGGTVVGGRKLYNHLVGKMAPDAIQAATGQKIVEVINADRQMQGLPPITASEYAAQIAAAGPNASALDIFPGLQKYANRIIREGGDAAKRFYDLIATRAELWNDLTDPRGTLRQTFQSPAVRSEQTIMRDVKAKHASMQPEYDKVYEANQDVRFSGKQMLNNVATVFGPRNEWDGAKIEAFSLMKAQVDMLRKQAGSTTRGKKPQDALTLRQTVKDVLNFLQRAANSETVKVVGKDAPVTRTNEAGLALQDAAHAIKTMVQERVPDLAPLNKVYGDYMGIRTAYKAGKKAFSSADIDSADIKAFLNDPQKSALSKMAFVEGAKYHLFKKLDAAKTAQAMDKILTQERPLVESMEAMFGKEATTDMIASVRKTLTQVKSAQELEAAARSGTASQFVPNTGPELKSLVDAGIALGAPFGITSKAGGFGAVGRLLGRAPAESIEQQADTFAGEIIGTMGERASTSFEELQKLLRRSALASQGGDVRQSAGAAAMGSAVDSATGENFDGQLP
jgi:hypothetical protein